MAVAVAAWVALAGAAPASAATLKVCPSGCTYSTIQDAIDHAHSGDTINIAAATGSYAGFSLPGGNTNGLTSIALTGAGPGKTTIDGQFSTAEVVEIGPGVSVNLSGVTITDGCACSEDSSSGGGILNGGTLRLSNSTVSDNAARDGSGIYNDGGTLTLNNSTVSNNFAGDAGAGIFNGGTLTLNNSTVSSNGNSGGAFLGGGIYNGGTLTLNNSTVSGNAAILGGGIYNGGTGTLNNSTVSGNRAGGLHPEGGGIFNHGTLTLHTSTVTGNTAGGSLPTDEGGGIFIEGGFTVLSNSTVQCNTPDDIFPPGGYVVIGKNNEVGGGSC